MNRSSFVCALAFAVCASKALAAGGPMPAYPGCPQAGTYMPYSKTAVHLRFNAIVLCNLQKNPNVNALIAGMSNIDLARLSYQVDREYQIYGPAFPATPRVADYLQVSAQRFTAKNLIKVRSAFGIETDAAVARYSSLAIQSAYFSAIHPAPVVLSRAQVQSVGGRVQVRGTVTVQGTVVAAPILDMTLYEVYLEYYTAGWSATAALAAASTYVSANVALAWGVGQVIGTGVYWANDAIDENINIWIGDQIGGMAKWVCKGGICTKEK